MITPFALVKFFHILLAIIAVGFNATYGILFSRAAKGSKEVQKHTLESVRALDRVASWAYVLLLLSGGGMVTMGHFRWSQAWTAGSMVLLVVTMGLAHGMYTPTIKKQMAALDASGPESPEYQRLAGRANGIGMGVLFSVVVILAMMVLKPF